MFYCSTKDNDFIFKQGDYASSFFIIERGIVSILVNDKEVAQLKNGDSFGELGILYKAPRSASAKCIGEVYFWGIDRYSFRLFIKEVTDNFTPNQKDSLAFALIYQIFHEGEIIIREGEMGNSFFMIKSGTVAVLKNNKEISTLSEFQGFGESALNTNSPRLSTIKALTDVTLLSISRKKMNEVLGKKLRNVIHHNVLNWTMETSRALRKLTKAQVHMIIENIKIKSYNKDEKILSGADNSAKLYFILEGGVQCNSKIYERGEIIGEDLLMESNEEIDSLKQGSLVCKKPSSVGYISIKNFHNLIGGKFSKVIRSNEKNYEYTFLLIQSDEKESNTFKIKYQLEDYHMVKFLGAGHFGNVFLVYNSKTKDFHALKCLYKPQIIHEKTQKYIKQEKLVLSKINFPFCVQFIKSFKDSQFIYLLLDYIPGKELFDSIREMGILTSWEAKFFVGQMIFLLEYFDGKNIIYRDLKPENLMVDETGYLKLIDFGSCTLLCAENGFRTYTMIGTPQYMAPEVILNKAYTINVDLWSLGVCLFEFVCGVVPFGEEQEDPYEIYEIVIKGAYEFPTYLKDIHCINLIMQLLSLNPQKRKGNSFAELKANPFFNDLDWDGLFSKEIKPPYIPNVSHIDAENAKENFFKENSNILLKVRVKNHFM